MITERDVSSLISQENLNNQQIKVQEDILKLLTLLNTHQLLTEGGADLYKSEGGYTELDLTDSIGQKLYDSKELSRFLSTTIHDLAEQAYGKGDDILEVAAILRDYDTDDQKSGEKLEKVWKRNQSLLQNLIDLYSEYLNKVYIDNPFQSNLIGLKRSENV